MSSLLDPQPSLLDDAAVGPLRTSLLSRRRERGMTQQAVARAADLSRQSLGALETGRSVPSTLVALRLARALDCRVEDLFSLAPADESLAATLAAPLDASPPARRRAGAAWRRVAVVSVRDRWIAHRLPPTDAVATAQGADGLLSRSGRGRVALLEPAAALRETLLVVGCAPALGLLASRTAAR